MSRPTSTPGLPPASPAPMRTLATQVHGDDARGDSDLVTPGTDALVRSGGGTGVTGARQVNTSYSPSTEGGSNRSEQNLQSGFKWGGSTMGTAVAVTYSFTSATSTYTYAEQALPGRFAFSDTAGALAAMAAYSDVSLLTFNQLADTASSAGDIRWGMTTTTAVTSAYASFPSNTAQGGDIWFGPNVLPFLPVADGNYAFHTFMHELGHAVGLDHPHEALVTPVAGEDQMKYSVMSYRSYAGDDVGGAYTNDVFPRTLMINDIQAVQFLYGVNTTTATGDNLYSWGAFESVFETIWDAGGNDTLSAATQQQGSTLFLTPGKWSQIGQSYFNGQALVRDTLTIAYDVVIENALGSDFTDTLEGNTAANRLDGASGSDLLSGLGGNDTLIGGFGSDTLDGGPGADRFEPGIGTGDVVIGGADADTLVLPGQRAQYTITAPAAGDLLLVRTATGENITARQVESFAFSDVTLPVGDITPLPSATSGADTLTGTSADNLIDGLGGNDSLSGLGGNDTLVGGTGLDTLAGGPGDDTYEVDVPGDRITEAAPDGFDTMVIVAGATGSFALPLNVEKANVLSTLAVNVTGNASDNTLWGDAGPNSLNGGLGHDAIVGFGGNDTLVGADGLDTLTGGAGNDTLDGGAGNDLLTPRGGVDTVAGGTDTDTLVLEGNRAAYTITSLNATDLRLLSVALGQDVTVRQVELFQFADGTRTLAAIAPPTAAADTLEGSAGADSIDGLGGNDSISGLGGNDTLVGGPGLDTLAGGADDDVYRVDVPGDVVIESAGGGFDEVEVPASVTVAGTYSVPANVELFNVLSTAAINVLGNEAANVIWGDVGPNSITGAAGNDTLDGYSGNDTLLGGDDADRLRGMIGNDSLDGGAGNDTLVSEIGTDTMSGGPGEDLLQLEGARADYLISAVNATDLQLARTAGGETLLVRQVEWFSFSNGLFSLADIAPPGVPTAGPDMLTGTAGNDSIDGLGGNDSINGQGGNDTLVGGLGLDTLEGGAGNDRYRLDVAGDVVLEGPDGGIDWVDVGFTAVGTYTLPAHVDSAQVTSTQVVHMVGNTLPNTLVGNAAANSLTGGDGNDVLDGGAGRDTLIGGKGDDSYRLDNPLDVVNETAPGSGGYDQVDLFFTVSGSYRLPTGVEVAVNWSSPEVAVTLTGHDAGVVLVGGAGAQTLIGGAGADSLYPEGGNDSVSGGAGRDYLEYLLGPVQINLATGVVTGAGGNDTVSGIEDMAGTSLGDQLVAAPTGSLIYPLGGDDTVEGGVGNDVVHQLAAGLQQLSGGPGTDILILMPEASAGLMVNLPDGLATGPAGFEATIVGFEEVATGDGPDTLIGDDTGNTFRPGAGNDSLSGGKGTDTVSLVDAPSAVQVNLATGRTAGGLGIDTLNSIEQVRLPGFDDAFTGSAGFEYAFGGMGNDTLDGAGGGDWLDGGPGNNSLVGGSGVDTASYIDSSTSVVVNLALSTATHGGGADTLVGVEGVAGSAFADTLSGSDGDNALDGGSGADVLFGGKGSDLVQFKLQGQAVNASLVTNRATVGSVVDTLSGIEHLEGSGGNDTLTGDDGANQLLGGKGADLLTGNGGNDTLVATQGADTVDGGADTDLMVLDDNRSVFTVTRTTATDTRFEAFGTAVVARGIESVSFADGTVSIAELWGNTPSAFDDILTGNGDANAIDGLAGNDSLSGLGGNDTLNGGSGNDTLAGGADDDLYIVDGAGDQVVESDGAGTDTVLTALTVAGTVILPDHVEHGTAQAGTLAISLSGNGLDNRLTGNAGNNSLGGSLGNDTMDGGAGADTLNGSAGDDQYWVDVPADQVNEAPLAGYDIVFIAAGASGSFSFPSQVEQIAIAGGNAVNVLANVTDNFIVAGTGPNSLSGAAGNDTFDLRGTAHGDTVDGGDGVADRVLLAGGVADYRVQRPNATDTVLQAPFETVTLRNIELVSFSDQDVVLSTLFGNAATPGADSLTGTDGDDLIDGLGGNDTLSGGGGSDTLVGGTGIDRLVGGKGNDTYRVDVVTDAVVEELNAGDDLVEVTLATAGSYALPDHVERATAMGTAAVALVGNGLSNLLTGNATGNNLQGGGGADTLDGGAGNDTLAGGAGNDRYLLNASTDQVNETTAGSDGFDTVVLSLPGSGSYTLPAGVEYATVEGSAGSAVNLLGNTLANVLRGHAGNNSLAGGDGGDALWPDVGSDTVDGGNDNDMLVLDATLGNYVITRPSATQVLFTGAGQSVLATGIEQVYTLPDNVSTPLAGLIARIGSPGADTLQGDGFNESLNGVAGNDSVDGGLGGNDTLDGGAGNDTLFGGKGDDLLDGGEGSDTYRFSRDGALDLIEQNDTVAASVDVVQMGSGITAADVSYQRGYFSFDDLVITVGGPSGVDEQVVVLNFFLGDGINPGTVDQVRLASGAITTQAQMAAAALQFDGGGHVFVGYAGNDTINGDVSAPSADWIKGGSGNDALAGLAAADTLYGGGGNDTVSGGPGADMLAGGAGPDTLRGGTGNDTLSGGAGGDRYVLELGDGIDVLHERLDVDLWDSALDSGVGPFYAPDGGDQPGSEDLDVLALGVGIAPDQVLVRRYQDMLFLQVQGTGEGVMVPGYFAPGVPTLERILFSSGSSWSVSAVRAMVLVPTAGGDALTGYLGADALAGLEGDDILEGREGNDTLTGGEGADTLMGGNGRDRFVFNRAADGTSNLDIVLDFTPGVDRLVLSKAVFTALTGAVGTLLDPDTNAFVGYNPATGALTYDADGEGTGAAAVTVALLGVGSHPAALGLDVMLGS